MDFRMTDDQNRFRQEVRDFLEQEIRNGAFEVRTDSLTHGASPSFTRKVAERGWIGMTWPKEYGGQGRSYLDRLILTEEMLRYGAPAVCHWAGDRQIGPGIIAHGSPELRKEILPRIVRGELYFAIGMSEPEAGSDLASLRTQAVEDGDCYVINGQKVWTSTAHFANFLYLVARTDPTAPKHRGISEFLVDIKLPGITVRPIIDMSGEPHYNEVFLDDVRVPKKYLIGEKNRGFYQILSQLDYERCGIERLMSNYPLFDALVHHVMQSTVLAEDPLVRHSLAQLAIEFEVGRLFIYRIAWQLDQGRLPTHETAMAKAYCTDFEQKLANQAMTILGPYGQLRASCKYAPLNGQALTSYLLSPGYTIQGGTSEILRNLVASRGLGLPGQ